MYVYGYIIQWLTSINSQYILILCSSQYKRQQPKKILPGQLPADANLQPNSVEESSSDNSNTDNIAILNQDAISNDAVDTTIVVEHSNGKDSDDLTLLNEIKSPVCYFTLTSVLCYCLVPFPLSFSLLFLVLAQRNSHLLIVDNLYLFCPLVIMFASP